MSDAPDWRAETFASAHGADDCTRPRPLTAGFVQLFHASEDHAQKDQMLFGIRHLLRSNGISESVLRHVAKLGREEFRLFW